MEQCSVHSIRAGFPTLPSSIPVSISHGHPTCAITGLTTSPHLLPTSICPRGAAQSTGRAPRRKKKIENNQNCLKKKKSHWKQTNSSDLSLTRRNGACWKQAQEVLGTINPAREQRTNTVPRSGTQQGYGDSGRVKGGNLGWDPKAEGCGAGSALPITSSFGMEPRCRQRDPPGPPALMWPCEDGEQRGSVPTSSPAEHQ